jgi:hypothetical protein
MEMAKASMIENNAFIVLYCSFLTARMRLPDRERELEVKKYAQDVEAPKTFGLGPPGFEPGTKGL